MHSQPEGPGVPFSEQLARARQALSARRREYPGLIVAGLTTESYAELDLSRHAAIVDTLTQLCAAEDAAQEMPDADA